MQSNRKLWLKETNWSCGQINLAKWAPESSPSKFRAKCPFLPYPGLRPYLYFSSDKHHFSRQRLQCVVLHALVLCEKLSQRPCHLDVHIGGWVDPTCTFYRHQDSGNCEVKTFSNTSSCRIPWNDLSYFIAVGNRVGIDIRKVSSWSCSRISDLLDWWPWHVFTDASSLQPLDSAKKQDVNMPFHFIHSIFLWIWKVWVTVARSLG